MATANYVRQLNKLLAGTPMANRGRLIARIENKNRLPRGLLAGIARAESSFGTAGRSGHQTNPFGWMRAGGPSSGLYPFKSMDQAIRHVGNTLGQRGWRDPAKFEQTYVGYTNSPWLGNVQSVMSKFGGGAPAAPAPVRNQNRGRSPGQRSSGASSNQDQMLTLLTLIMARRSGAGASGIVPILLQQLQAPPTKTKSRTKGVEVGPGVSTSSVRGKTVQRALQEAKRFIGTPYVFGSAGGRSDFTNPSSFDCSGFISYVWFKATGKKLPAYTGDLVRLGRSIPRGKIQAGDAIFFSTYQQNGHVGMALGNGKFIHASSSGAVKISSLADYPYKPSAIRRYDT